MDSLTLLGIIFAACAIVFGQVLDGGQLSALLNLPALIIVLGGTIGAVMVQTPLVIFKRAFYLIPWVFIKPRINSQQSIEQIIAWSKQARQMGLLSLESRVEKLTDPIERQGLEMVLAGVDKETMRKVLETEVDNKEVYNLHAARVFESMGGYSPTIGILGAVIGLIGVMRHLSDPSELGLGIAVAFVATIYGVGFANLLFLPVANKLKYHIHEQIRHDEMTIEGLVALSEGDNPHNIAMKMKSYCQRF